MFRFIGWAKDIREQIKNMAKDLSFRSMAAADLGVSLHQWCSQSGGDFAQSYVATMENTGGARLFIKTHANPPPHHFSTEARGLAWLAETNTVRVPKVLGVSDKVPYLAIEWIEESPQRQATSRGEEEFGRQLAALHQAYCPNFGREDERSTGSLGLPNSPCERWSDFYATNRLLPLAQIASERKALSSKLLNAIETLAGRLDQWESSSDTPARLHGDLWAGNRLVDGHGNSWVIDPASHGGHREFDLAMMRLFGGYGRACFDAYQEVYPLSEGWQDRIALHQLAPLIVHAIKFGDAYVAPTEDALAQYV